MFQTDVKIYLLIVTILRGIARQKWNTSQKLEYELIANFVSLWFMHFYCKIWTFSLYVYWRGFYNIKFQFVKTFLNPTYSKVWFHSIYNCIQMHLVRIGTNLQNFYFGSFSSLEFDSTWSNKHLKNFSGNILINCGMQP